ncbi:MAG: glycosyltransferase family 2 protein [bacterium]|nr:glycosyltransferase family 2 protein [bacterium]
MEETSPDITKKCPMVSIGLPTFNRAHCIRKCLDSLIAQTYPHIELIISDDGSTDETQSICEEYARKDPRIRYFRQLKNKGLIGNFYFVLSQAKGDYFGWAVDDDWFAPQYVEKHVEALEKNLNHGGTGCSYHRLYGNGEVEEEIVLTGDQNMTNQSYYQVFAKVLQKKYRMQYMFHGIYRTKLIQGILPHALKRTKGWDCILVSELALATHFYSIPEVLHYFGPRREDANDMNYYRSTRDLETNQPRVRKTYFFGHTHAHLVYRCTLRALTSPIVPLQRKLGIFIPVSIAIFAQRKKIFGFFYASPKRFFQKNYWRNQ